MSEYQTYSCRHCKEKPKGRGKRLPPTYKRRSDEELYQMVLDQILKYKRVEKLNVTAEKMAQLCQVKVHRVEQVFMKLNQEGILSQAHNEAPMDSTRGLWGGGCESSWCASYYRIL